MDNKKECRIFKCLYLVTDCTKCTASDVAELGHFLRLKMFNTRSLYIQYYFQEIILRYSVIAAIVYSTVLSTATVLSACCAVVSLKPGHMDWVRDFDFMLNLFSLPSCSSERFLTVHSGRALGTVH